MEPRGTPKKWKRWKRTVFRSSTDNASGSKLTLSTSPTLTEPADQSAEFPSNGKQVQDIQVRDLKDDALRTFSAKDKARTLQSSSAFQAFSDSISNIITEQADQTAKS